MINAEAVATPTPPAPMMPTANPAISVRTPSSARGPVAGTLGREAARAPTRVDSR